MIVRVLKDFTATTPAGEKWSARTGAELVMPTPEDAMNLVKEGFAEWLFGEIIDFKTAAQQVRNRKGIARG
jgi:hypothetical protein